VNQEVPEAEEFQLGSSPLNKEQCKTLSEKACHHYLDQTNPTLALGPLNWLKEYNLH
jgi:hypothetical protein